MKAEKREVRTFSHLLIDSQRYLKLTCALFLLCRYFQSYFEILNIVSSSCDLYLFIYLLKYIKLIITLRQSHCESCSIIYHFMTELFTVSDFFSVHKNTQNTSFQKGFLKTSIFLSFTCFHMYLKNHLTINNSVKK